MRNASLQDFHKPVKVNCMLRHGAVTEYCNHPQVSPSQTQHRLLYISHVAVKMKDSVEFALHPQHETSCDPKIQIKEDLKSKFRKQLGSSSITPLNSKDKEEALQC